MRFKLSLSSISLKFCVVLLCVLVDIFVVRKLCGFKGYSVYFGCFRCLKVFFGGFGEKKDYFGFDRESWEVRIDR